jgi:hypothetical protein
MDAAHASRGHAADGREAPEVHLAQVSGRSRRACPGRIPRLMPIQHWDEMKWYDPVNDRDSIRVSGHSGHGVYWVSQPLTLPGKSRRAQRTHLLYLIEQAIERGDEPGEVAYAEPALEQARDPIFDPDRY